MPHHFKKVCNGAQASHLRSKGSCKEENKEKGRKRREKEKEMKKRGGGSTEREPLKAKKKKRGEYESHLERLRKGGTSNPHKGLQKMVGKATTGGESGRRTFKSPHVEFK